jgi:hypothetical protein
VSISTRTLEAAAVELAEHGYHVFPCKPAGKTPLTSNGFKAATLDEAKILRGWDVHPTANIGISCGASGIVALDIDAKHGADPREVISALDLGSCPTVRTGEAPERDAEHPHSLPGVRGAHVVFRGSERTYPKTGIGGVELRGGGAYIVAPPSVHSSGVRYEGTLPPVARLPEIPGSVRAILPVQDPHRSAAPASNWLDIVRAGAPAGQRNAELTRFVGHLLRRYVDVDLVAELAHLVNAYRFTPPLDASEVDKIVDSIAGREARRRAARS